MAKKTALNYLLTELSENKCISVPSGFWDTYKELVKSAYEMEKKQIQAAHLAGQNTSEEIDEWESEIEYYKSTFIQVEQIK